MECAWPDAYELMRFLLAVVLLLAALVAVTIVPARLAGTAGAPGPPRLVIVLTIDALRADHLGTYGYTRPTSPNIDAFARDAVVIDQAIAQAPYTKASIASLMTALYPSGHKTITTAYSVEEAMRGDVRGTPPKTDILPSAVVTMAEAFKAAGYTTAAITTNPFLIRDFGFAQGFDRFEFMGGEGFAHADAVLGRALHEIGDGATRLFLWVHLMEPHSPYSPPAAVREGLPPLQPPELVPPSVAIPAWISVEGSRDVRFYESLYDGEIRVADTAFGAFVTALRARDLWPETALVVTADHGEQFMEHGGFEHNTNLYDELVRVPLVIRVPGLAPRYVHAQVQLVDVMPTLLTLVGAHVPPMINGRDVGPLLRGERMHAEAAFAEIAGQQYMVRTPEWKLVATPDGGRELFALTRDPREQHPVTHPRRTAELLQVLDGLLESALRLGARIDGETGPVRSDSRRRLEALGYIQR